MGYIKAMIGGHRQVIPEQGIPCPNAHPTLASCLYRGKDGSDYQFTPECLQMIYTYCQENAIELESGMQMNFADVEMLKTLINRSYRPEMMIDKKSGQLPTANIGEMLDAKVNRSPIISVTTKNCPRCQHKESHFHGHSYHHVHCKLCRFRFCFVCLSSERENRRKRSRSESCCCGSWNGFCAGLATAADVEMYLA